MTDNRRLTLLRIVLVVFIIVSFIQHDKLMNLENEIKSINGELDYIKGQLDKINYELKKIK